MGDTEGDGGGADSAAEEAGDALEGEDVGVGGGEGFVLLAVGLEDGCVERGWDGKGGRITSFQVPERLDRDLEGGAAIEIHL